LTEGADGAIIHWSTNRLVMGKDKASQLIDSLIIECLSREGLSFDDVFLYVGRNFPINTRQPEEGSVPPRFYFLVEGRMKALKRKGLISCDRKLSRWCYNKEVANGINAEAAVPA
jgi:hypothetical protein